MNTDSKRRLRARLRDVTREAILEAVEEVIAELGVEGAAMQTIAGRAGTSVGTLYNYFENRDVLIRALLAARRRELHGRLEAVAREPAEGFPDRLRALVGAALEHFEAHRRFLSIAVNSERVHTLRFDPESEPPERPALVQLEERVRALTRRAAETGELRPDDAALYPVMLVGLVRGVLLHRLNAPDDGVTLLDDTERIVGLFLEGALAREGR